MVPLNIFSVIGVIMLMGLVTKNANLLVDFVNRMRRLGMPRAEQNEVWQERKYLDMDEFAEWAAARAAAEGNNVGALSG